MLCQNRPLTSVCSKIAIFRNPLHKVLPRLNTIAPKYPHIRAFKRGIVQLCTCNWSLNGQRSNLRVLHLPYKNKHLFGVSNLTSGYSKIRLGTELCNTLFESPSVCVLWSYNAYGMAVLLFNATPFLLKTVILLHIEAVLAEHSCTL